MENALLDVEDVFVQMLFESKEDYFEFTTDHLETRICKKVDQPLGKIF